MPIEKNNYYDILGVEKTATEAEIKEAYRKKALNIIQIEILIIKKNLKKI